MLVRISDIVGLSLNLICNSHLSRRRLDFMSRIRFIEKRKLLVERATDNNGHVDKVVEKEKYRAYLRII